MIAVGSPAVILGLTPKQASAVEAAARIALDPGWHDGLVRAIAELLPDDLNAPTVDPMRSGNAPPGQANKISPDLIPPDLSSVVPTDPDTSGPVVANTDDMTVAPAIRAALEAHGIALPIGLMAWQSPQP